MTLADYSGITPAFDLQELPNDVDLVQLMRNEISRHPETAPCWMIHNGEQFPLLAVGLRAEAGALMWDHGTSVLIPTDGRNTEDTDYFLGNRDHSPFPPRTELPVDRVLAAVDEFVRTGQRPTCVEWTAEA